MTEMQASHDSPHTHLALETVTAYLDRALPGSQLDAVEGHLAECGSCRQEVAEVRGVIRSRRRRAQLLVAAPTLAAATLVLVVLRTSTPVAPPEGVLRSSPPSVEPASVPGIMIVAPMADAVVPSRALTFRWHAVAGTPGAVRYVVTLTDDRGNLLWTSEATNTHLVLPGSVALTANRPYLWSVDARLPDGRTITSGLHEFRTSP